MSDVVRVKEGEAKIGLVFFGDGAAEVGVFEVYFYAVSVSMCHRRVGVARPWRLGLRV